jgi:uncharacterized protein YsxB (DUF464 family)
VLEVIFYRDASGRLTGISAGGHADFAEHGQDIVCAAVSAILQAARLGLQEHVRVELDARQAAGTLHLRWSAESGELESLRAIVSTAELAVAQIARRYPQHVTLRRREREPIAKALGRVTRSSDRRRRHDV